MIRHGDLDSTKKVALEAIQSHVSTASTPRCLLQGSTRWSLTAIVILALGLRLAYVAGLAPETVFASVDAHGYHLLAVNLLEHGAFSLQEHTPYLPDAVRTPLYPLLLALLKFIGGDLTGIVLFVQSLLDSVTVVMAYALASRLTNARAGLFAALLYAVNPFSFLFIGEALTEILLDSLIAMTFVVFVVALTEHSAHGDTLLAVAGCLSSLCILCKPNAILLPLILVLGLIIWHRGASRRLIRQAAIILAVSLIILLPWLVRNRLTFGEWFLSLAFEDNLAHVSAVATILKADGQEVAPWTPRWEETYMSHVVGVAYERYRWAERSPELTAQEMVRRQHEVAAVATDIIRQHPLDFVSSHVSAVLRSFVPSLHRHWYAYLSGQPWPQTEPISAALTQARRQVSRGNWAAGLYLVRDWWVQLPPLAGGLWLISNIVYAIGYGLLLVGLAYVLHYPRVFSSLVLTMLYFVWLPGPIASIRFWVPAMSLAAAAIACAFAAMRVPARKPDVLS